jgi:ribosome recycling factor
MDLNNFSNDLQEVLEFLKEELSQIRSGRATPELLFGVQVEAYGARTPLKNVATISVSDSKSLLVSPWDKGLVSTIDSGIRNSGLGVSCSAEGSSVRVRVPDMTEERRKEYVKIMNDRVEHGRISVRNVRQKYMKEVEAEVEDGLSEDQGKRFEQEIEKQVKDSNEKLEVIRKAKEEELMSV